MSGIAIGRNAQVVQDQNREDFNNIKKKLSLTYLYSDARLEKRDKWTS
jgi:hypothetical protein